MLFLAVAAVITGLAVWKLRQILEKPVKHIRTGAQRRQLYPIDHPIGPGAAEVLARGEVNVRRQTHTLRSGQQLFYQLVSPNKRIPTHILVFVHGYTSHSDLYLEAFAESAKQGALVVMLDLPNHGRSDGLIGYIPDWWAWISQIWEFMDSVVGKLKADSGKPPCRVFLAGNSLGGGVAACLAAMRPNFFDGMVLIAPMLLVADDLKPSWLVQQIFKHLVGPFKLTLPLTPSKPTDSFDFRVPTQSPGFTAANPLSMCGLLPRLGTALQLGFVFPDWMKEKLGDIRTPMLIQHGTADMVCDPAASHELMEQALCTDKTLKLYEGAYHCELLCCVPGNARLLAEDFLPEQYKITQQCLTDLNSWIGKRA